jgi:class 3 adenylate cyclase
MMPFRTAVLMKTDIAGSTPRFRALLAADQQTLLHEHRALITRHAADQGGHIIQLTGDGYWLEFPSVTAAAKAAIAMQEALRLAQPSRGDNRISIRVVIGLGDIAMVDGALVGDTVPLIVRIEKITPKDEIYLTAAARSALAPAEIQTALVDSPNYARRPVVTEMQRRSLCFWLGEHSFAQPWNMAVRQGSGRG